VDRQDFVEAGELLEGEQVRLYNGETKRVVQKLPRPGPEIVYNLEVYAEHVYHVTQDGILVHNSCDAVYIAHRIPGGGLLIKQRISPKAAISRLKRGKDYDIFAGSKRLAEKLQRAAGNNKVFFELNGNGKKGYFFHYHDIERKNGHAFFKD